MSTTPPAPRRPRAPAPPVAKPPQHPLVALEALEADPRPVPPDLAVRAEYWAQRQALGPVVASQLWGLSPAQRSQWDAQLGDEWGRSAEFRAAVERVLVQLRADVGSAAREALAAGLRALATRVVDPTAPLEEVRRATELLAKITGTHQHAMAEAAAAGQPKGAPAAASPGVVVALPASLALPRTE